MEIKDHPDVPPARRHRKSGRDALTPEAFAGLLDWLARDRDLAGQSYERIREKLTKFFEWRGAADASELADRTIDRVSTKVGQGAIRDEVSPTAYFFGVARNILREHQAEGARRYASVRELSRSGTAASTTSTDAEESASRERTARRLEDCLDLLPPGDRDLIVAYYQGERHHKLANRRALAARLGIGMNALWIRTHRIRMKVEACLTGDPGTAPALPKATPPERDDPQEPL
jgi:RNA polymerase sigma factor (sigma-70 family)